MTVNERLRQRVKHLKQFHEQQRDADLFGPLEPNGGGGESGEMDGLSERVTPVEGRLDRVEERLSAVKMRLGRIKARLDSLEDRMGRLETRMDGLDARLRSVEQSLSAISAKLDLLVSTNAQLVGKLPSWWQMPAIMAGTITLLGVLFTLAKTLKLL